MEVHYRASEPKVTSSSAAAGLCCRCLLHDWPLIRRRGSTCNAYALQRLPGLWFQLQRQPGPPWIALCPEVTPVQLQGCAPRQLRCYPGRNKLLLRWETPGLVSGVRGPPPSPFVLRARRSMDKSGMPWHLRYLGQPEIGDKNRHALVRNCVDIATSDNLTDFLVEMGFRMDHEFVAKGHVFRKGIMKIVVYKIFRILMPGNTESIEPLSLSYLVELNVVAPAGQDVVSDDMRNFAEQLKPLVHLEKIDPKRLM
ncbi:PREDICTED: mediator of RNA polymerase II transcription subunit 18 [Pygoscelis adeliae]|nr:PREDICTED: mediator of RNA polymerase II transcription subunit 18 [Pygoscelis adeliae]